MKYFRAWYRREGDPPPPTLNFSDWVIYARDEDDARQMALAGIGRPEPERGYAVFLHVIEDEDAGTVALAKARQDGQALP